ncbi:MAG: M28 family peptidase [Gemmatimonadota bacterium]|nr:M28 family peptidase [Gemmatimonadota bacterium]
MKPVWPDEGPLTWKPRPTVPDITANDLRTRLYQFADDSMLGRRIGEPGNAKGTAYIAREFQRLGLKPGGDNGTYFQNLPYGTAGFDSTSAMLSVDGRPLRSRTEWIPMAPSGALGAGGSASIADIPTVFAGRWGDTAVVLDRERFAGKVAVFTASPARVGYAPPRSMTVLRCDSLPDTFGAGAAAAREAFVRDSTKAAGGTPAAGGRSGAVTRDTRAQRAGAAGILFVVLDSVPRTTVKAAFNGHLGMAPVSSEGATITAAAISRSVADALFGGSIGNASVGSLGAPITERWTYTFRPSPAPARNVIAILPGSDPARASEFVLVGAHNDHNGVNAVGVDHDSLRAVNTVTRRQGANDPVCRPSPEQQHRIDSLIAHARRIRPAFRDSIMNGADDDGSGTVLLLEIAERFAHEKPSRSIIFVSHQGEEAGLLGSEWFTDHPTIPLTSVVAAHNMDMEGKGRIEQVKFGGPHSVQTLGSRRYSREFGDIIDSVNAVRPETMAIDKTWDVPANPLNRFCRSDQVNYVHHNIPTTYFSTGYAQDYHQVTDEPRYINYEHMASVGRFVHDIMWAVSERRDRPRISGADPSYPVCR